MALSEKNDTQRNHRTILVVDDSAYVRRMIRFALPSELYTVVEAGDGIDALKYLENTPTDLLITDLKMPNMDGFSLIRELRSRPGLEYLPIIMLTGESGEQYQNEAREAGVSAFIVKPFVPEQISGLIQSIFA